MHQAETYAVGVEVDQGDIHGARLPRTSDGKLLLHRNGYGRLDGQSNEIVECHSVWLELYTRHQSI